MRINGSNANKSTLMQTKHKIMPPPSPWYKEDTSPRVLKYQSDKIPFLVKSTFSKYFLQSQWKSPQACDSRKDPRATPVLPGTPLGLDRKQKLVSSAPEQGLAQGSSSAAIPAAAPSPASRGPLHGAGPAPPLPAPLPGGSRRPDKAAFFPRRRTRQCVPALRPTPAPPRRVRASQTSRRRSGNLG